MELKDWADIATIVSSIGVLVAIGALIFGWKQLKLSAKNTKHSAENSRAQLWMDLRKMFEYHREVHAILRPDKECPIPQPCPRCHTQKTSWPCCNNEWVKVEAYMGLFEHCEGLLAEKLIDEGTFNDIYRYRISNIVTNEEIYRTKLIENPAGWIRFLALMKRCGIPEPSRKDAR